MAAEKLKSKHLKTILNMKKITLMFSLFFLITRVIVSQQSEPPQLQQGNTLLGVTSTISLDGSWGSELFSLGFTNIKTKYGSDPAEDASKRAVWNFQPRVGYFIIDNLAVGLETAISGYKEKGANEYDTWSESLLAIGPFVRYYYPQAKFYPFAELEILFGTKKETYNENDFKYSIVLFGSYLGVAVPLGEKVTFDAKLGYANATLSHKGLGVEDIDIKILSGGLVIAMGFSVYLPLP
ncbi:MAG: hypothetical protein ABR531_02965 [Bacteroidales bacterium]